ncbi:enoyl-CoA hydratase [Flavisphingomonas formosensis]|uniref:enoyl-CoA hydratase n=1 Tax=Flavisphingomonas formosensis TaxID=861534 RepID=UPI0012FAB6D5|nr:enoyl-CoA hydratase [Sphingomonas formosensis]
MSYIDYEVQDAIALITLNRPDRRNAQNQDFLEQLDAAWDKAAQDGTVRVILLKANGPHFSAGHDLTQDETNARTMAQTLGDIPNTGMLNLHNWEQRYYLGLSRKWRDIPKPSIAAVQGACIAGGLMLCWPCDLIIAADNAKFSDPVIRMGIGGVEYHGHTWEFGARKAKELLFTGRSIDAETACALGMVNRVVPLDGLVDAAMELAREIAQMHPHALAMAKRAVNQTLDIQGQQAALQACFDIHQLGHASAYAQSGQVILTGLQGMKDKQ